MLFCEKAPTHIRKCTSPHMIQGKAVADIYNTYTIFYSTEAQWRTPGSEDQ